MNERERERERKVRILNRIRERETYSGWKHTWESRTSPTIIATRTRHRVFEVRRRGGTGVERMRTRRQRSEGEEGGGGGGGGRKRRACGVRSSYGTCY